VPEAELEAWQRLGFTHIWLMGVWVTGRAAGLAAAACPGRGKAAGRPAGFLGGGPGGLALRHRGLRGGALAGRRERPETAAAPHAERGLKLVLDFVPNHTGLDHPWLREKPDLYVQSPGPPRRTFPRRYADGNSVDRARQRPVLFRLGGHRPA